MASTGRYTVCIMPDTVDVAAMMRDERDTGGSDGIYPTHMTDSGGNVITNPMEVNREKHGLSCSYLDMYIQFKARGHIQFTVCNKRDDMIVLQNYRRFPHITSTMAHSFKYNVFKSQLHRFASRCDHWSTFADNAKRLLTEMTTHGYDRNLLLKQLDGFWLIFAEQQLTVFKLTIRNPKQLWVRVMKVTGSSGPRVIVTDLASPTYTSCTVSCSSQVRNNLF
jgi:hypothetical protein